ncbi:MAG: histidine phosphatase family protein [Crocinitomicaceae bacterium]|nr:histidine phosphatase family protein [Crocinitomicaceae bacterium]
MLRLFLLRHGKATNNQGDTIDFNRQLNKKGQVQVNQIGYILKEKHFKIEAILSSSAVRTSETAEIVNHYLKLPQIHFDRELYLAECLTILKQINLTKGVKNLLYVGHNNGISELAAYLSGKSFTMSTAELIVLEFDFDSWNMVSTNTGKVIDRIIPDVHVI